MIVTYIFSLPFEWTQHSNRPEITVTKQTQDSCSLSLANTAQRALSTDWDLIKEEGVEAHFLYCFLLNLGFLKPLKHLRA